MGEATAPPALLLDSALGLPLAHALDLARWQTGRDLAGLVETVEAGVGRSVEAEASVRADIRGLILHRLQSFPNAPDAAGVYRLTADHVRSTRRRLLFPGRVAAFDSRSAGHDSLTAHLVSMGLCSARYDGELNSWRNTFSRLDMAPKVSNPVDRLQALLERRAANNAWAEGDGADFSSLLRRGILASAMRQSMVGHAARWKFAPGLPAPLELLTGSGSPELIRECLPVLRELLLNQKRWAFFPAALAERRLATIAEALLPDEVAVIQRGSAMLEGIIETAGVPLSMLKTVTDFARELGHHTVVGAYRAGPHAPAVLYLAHADAAVEAGMVALADGHLNPHRGTPLLLELARLGCETGLGLDAFRGLVESAYARHRRSWLGAGARQY